MSTFDYDIKVTNSMGCTLIVGTKASAAAISITSSNYLDYGYLATS